MANYVNTQTLTEALKKTSVAVKNYVDGKFQPLEDERLATADKTLVGAINELQTNVTSSQTNITNLQTNVTNLQENVAIIQEIVNPSGEDASPLLSRVETLEEKMDGNGEGSVNARIDAKINEFANVVTDNGRIDTIKEMIEYVNLHGGEFKEVINDITDLKELVGKEPVGDQIIDAINSSGHISEKESKAVFAKVGYEVCNVPNGVLVDYRDKEIRIMFPENFEYSLQNVGGTGDSNNYYFAFKAYAPEGAVSFKEDMGEIILDDTMYSFENNPYAGIDEYGRKYSLCWLAAAKFDGTNWTYYGANSKPEKYIGWTYSVEWYDANGIVVGSDEIRINLTNEKCHKDNKPYYINSVIETANAYTDAQIKAKIPETYGIEIVEF